jgi:hypothetical protein
MDSASETDAGRRPTRLGTLWQLIATGKRTTKNHYGADRCTSGGCGEWWVGHVRPAFASTGLPIEPSPRSTTAAKDEPSIAGQSPSRAVAASTCALLDQQPGMMVAAQEFADTP